MSTQTEDRFTRIVREMDAELTAKEKEIADLKSKLRMANFPTEQATNCGRCGKYKHTPWRDDEYGYGYVCASCLVEIHDERVLKLQQRVPESVEPLAAKLVSELLRQGQPPCERVALMTGKYPDDHAEGGMMRAAMETLFANVLRQHTPNPAPPSPLNEGR